jgi:hypothetical protein
MSTTEKISVEPGSPNLSEPLSWEEICARYPESWVCLVEMDWIDPHNQIFRTARVIGHGADPGEPLEQAEPWWGRYWEISHLFTGDLAPGRELEPPSSFEPWTYQPPPRSPSVP